VERAAEATFRCSSCGAANTLRTLSSAGTAPVSATQPVTRRTQPAASRRKTGRPAVSGKAAGGTFGRAKQVLVALMVVATATAFARNGGTFATFNAATSNPGSITTGVLLLGDTVANGSSVAECFSSGGATPGNPQVVSSANSSGCTGVWNGGTATKPGDSFIAHLAIRNPGNVAASTLTLSSTVANTCDSAPGVVDGAITYKGSNQAGLASTLSGATIVGATSFTLASAANFTIGEEIQVDTGTNFENLTISNIVGNVLTTNAATKAHANGVAVAGKGICRQFQLVIAQTNSSYNTLTTCMYGNTGAGSSPFTGCAYDTSHTLRDYNDNYATGGTPGPLSVAGGLAAGATKYFIVAMNFPNAAGSDNGFAGLGTSATFNWTATQ